MNNNVMNRVVLVQESKSIDNVTQSRVTISKDFIDLLGWKKGDKIKATLIIGSGMVCLENVNNEKPI